MLIIPIVNIRTKPSKSIKFKYFAIQRANLDGVPKAALDFGMSTAMLYAWQESRRLEDEVSSLENS